MNILYVATDVTFPGALGGSRRVLETARSFKNLGHKAVVLTEKSDQDTTQIADIIVYRKELFDIVNIFRTSLQKFRKQSEPKLSQFESHLDVPVQWDFKRKLKEFIRHKFPVHKFLRNIQYFPLLLRIIRKEKIDLIVERGPSYGIGILAAKITNRPCLVDFIDILYWDWALKNANGVLSYFVDYQVPAFIPREKISLVKMTADVHKFKPLEKNLELRRKYDIQDKDMLIVYIGGMYSWHGLDTLLDAAHILEKAEQSYKILIIGKGEMFPLIKKRIINENLTKMVKLTGRIPFDEVAPMLNSAEIAVSLNTGDAVGFKVVEYMAAGVVMIATNIDIMPQVAPHMEVAYLIPPSNPQELAKGIEYLGTHPEIRQQLAQKAREKAVKEYSWEKHAENILHAFLSQKKKMN